MYLWPSKNLLSVMLSFLSSCASNPLPLRRLTDISTSLGDSGFVQIRPGAIHHNSNPQTHAFNTPYQLSIVPPRVLALSRAFGGGPLSDLPDAADESTHTVRHGDVLVFATDGVWDNITPEEILKIVTRRMRDYNAWTLKQRRPLSPQTDSSTSHFMGSTLRDVHDSRLVGEITAAGPTKLQQLTTPSGKPLVRVQLEHGTEERMTGGDLQSALAISVVGEAKAASLDTKRDGPFAKEVRKHYPLEEYNGGKVDDICVVVAVVVGEYPQQQQQQEQQKEEKQ